MRKTLILATCMFGLSAAVVDSMVMGQGRAERRPAKPRRDAADQDIQKFWDPAKIMEVAVNNLSKRYNLNDEQKAFTNDMMTTRVTKFLEDHQDEIWPLLSELVFHQRTGEPPNPEVAKKLGPRVLKIVKEAKEEIYESNEEWREILTDDQKKVHDFDLEQMGKTFDSMEQNFSQWSKGNAQQTNIFPPPPTAKQPKAPAKPQPGIPTKSPKDVQEQPERLVSHFEEYVKQFIEDYQLTKNQIETAQSILREVLVRAKNHEQSKAKEIAAAKEKLSSAKDTKDRKRAKQELDTLNKPMEDLFTEMTTRLDSIPDKGQKERFKTQRGSTQSASASSKAANTRTAKPAAAKKPGGDGK